MGTGKRVFVLWVVLVLMFVAIYHLVAESPAQSRSLNEFIAEVEHDRVASVRVYVKGGVAEYAYRLVGATGESPVLVARGTPSEHIEALLLDHGVRVSYVQRQEASGADSGLGQWLMLPICFGAYAYFLWRGGRKRGKAAHAEPGEARSHPAAGSAPLEASYTLEARDQIDAGLAMSKIGHFVFFFGFLAAGQLFAIVYSIAHGEAPAFASSFMLFIFAFLVLALYVSPRVAHNRLSDAEKRVRFLVNDEGVEMLGGVTQCKVGWPGIREVTEDKRGVLFWLTAGRALFLPTRHLSEAQRKVLEPWIAPLKPGR